MHEAVRIVSDAECRDLHGAGPAHGAGLDRAARRADAVGRARLRLARPARPDRALSCRRTRTAPPRCGCSTSSSRFFVVFPYLLYRFAMAFGRRRGRFERLHRAADAGGSSSRRSRSPRFPAAGEPRPWWFSSTSSGSSSTGRCCRRSCPCGSGGAAAASRSSARRRVRTLSLASALAHRCDLRRRVLRAELGGGARHAAPRRRERGRVHPRALAAGRGARPTGDARSSVASRRRSRSSWARRRRSRSST